MMLLSESPDDRALYTTNAFNKHLFITYAQGLSQIWGVKNTIEIRLYFGGDRGVNYQSLGCKISALKEGCPVCRVRGIQEDSGKSSLLNPPPQFLFLVIEHLYLSSKLACSLTFGRISLFYFPSVVPASKEPRMIVCTFFRVINYLDNLMKASDLLRVQVVCQTSHRQQVVEPSKN